MALKGLAWGLFFQAIVVLIIWIMFAGAKTVSYGGICEEDMACWNCEVDGNGVCGNG